jgi:hypothetical protein
VESGLWVLESRTTGIGIDGADPTAGLYIGESSAGQVLGYSGLGSSLLVVDDLTVGLAPILPRT